MLFPRATVDVVSEQYASPRGPRSLSFVEDGELTDVKCSRYYLVKTSAEKL